MTLVVAAVTGPGRIDMVSDTMIWHESASMDREAADAIARANRHSIQNAVPKVFLARRNLAIGVAGAEPARAIQRLVLHRDRTVEGLLPIMMGLDGTSFAVGFLAPEPVLLRVRDGQVEDLTSQGRTYVGDVAAYGGFQRRWAEWPDGTDARFRLMSSIQWVIGLAQLEGVGGQLVHATSGTEGFKFVATTQVTLASPADNLVTIPMIGTGDTFGAIAYWFPQPGLAYLYRHEAPWTGVLLWGDSQQRIIAAALGLGQKLSPTAVPEGYPDEWAPPLA